MNRCTQIHQPTSRRAFWLFDYPKSIHTSHIASLRCGRNRALAKTRLCSLGPAIAPSTSPSGLRLLHGPSRCTHPPSFSPLLDLRSPQSQSPKSACHLLSPPWMDVPIMQPSDNRPCVIALPQTAHGCAACGTQEQQRERKVVKSAAPAHVHPSHAAHAAGATHASTPPPALRAGPVFSAAPYSIYYRGVNLDLT